jgi:hypothetical protein
MKIAMNKNLAAKNLKHFRFITWQGLTKILNIFINQYLRKSASWGV